MAGLVRPPQGVVLPSCATRSAPSGRSRLRVQGQAGGWTGVSPATPRMREHSPNTRVHAVAAPERLASRDTGSSVPPMAAPAAGGVPAPQQPVHAANAILPTPPDWLESARRAEDEQRREALERLMAREAGEAVDTPQRGDAAAQQQQLEEQQQQQEQQQLEEQQREAAEEEARQRERLAQSSAASTSGRAQQQQPAIVSSTRRGRLGARGRSTAPAPATPSRRASNAVAAAPATAAAVAAADLASATTIRTWLLDCSTRRVRHSTRPLPSSSSSSSSSSDKSSSGSSDDGSAPAAAQAVPQRGAGARSGRRSLLRARAASAAVRLNPAAVEGLSEETQADMVALVQARLPLSTARRFRRKGAASSTTGDTMSSYLRALGNTAVLGRAQEARLAGIMQRGRALEALAARLQGSGAAGGAAGLDLEALAAAAGLPSAADAAQVLLNRREAKDLLMQYNVRLVISIAKRYANNGIELEDLIPEGMVGLSKSLERFEPAKGFKFSTYAHWWIRQAISRAVCDQSRTVRLPSHVCEILYRINRAIATMQEDPDREEGPGYEEIAAKVGLPVQRVIQYLRLARVGSGNGPPGERGGYTSGGNMKNVEFSADWELEGDDDLLGGAGEELESEEHAACMRAVTDLMLGTLDKRERNILRMRYGLLTLRGGSEGRPGAAAAGSSLLDAGGLSSDAATMSLGEVAVAYGLSKERIRQIEEKALRALRKPWRMQLIRQLSFGQRVSRANLSHFRAAQELAGEEGLQVSL